MGDFIMQENKEIIVYKNELNSIPLRNFNSVEMDILFSILSQMRDKGSTEITFNLNELKHLSNYKKSNKTKEFIKDLEKTYDKLIQLNVKIGTATEFTKFVFFTRYSVSEEKKTISIKVNQEFAPLINEITGNFTKFELEELTHLSSSYSKSCYRLLKQYRKTGFYKVKIDTFKYLLDVPESYKNTSNFNSRVLKPIERDLKVFFKDLKIKKIKENKTNKKADTLVFTFKPQDDIKDTGYSTFRDKDTGEYREKHIMEFGEDEVKKEFPEIKGQFSADDYI
jgi:initiator repB protein